jgi:hypothetical protein
MRSVIAVLLFFASASTFGATFEPVKTMTSSAAKKLAAAVDSIAKNEKVFGDDSSSAAYSFTRKKSEQDLNTVKQLNHAYGGIFSGDPAGESIDSKSPGELASYLLHAVENMSGEEGYDEGAALLTEALEAVKADPDLKIYGTSHADEDGSWQIINLFDVKRHQILLVRIGYNGT